MYERHSEKLLPAPEFAARVARHLLLALGLIGASLSVGMGGYRWIARMSWIDAFLNASMLLGGMGPVGNLPNDSAKIFASLYAIFSGVAFLTIVAVLMAPLVHRFLHRFHLELADQDDDRT